MLSKDVKRSIKAAYYYYYLFFICTTLVWVSSVL